MFAGSYDKYGITAENDRKGNNTNSNKFLPTQRDLKGLEARR
jgi:hypothetical protein